MSCLAPLIYTRVLIRLKFSRSRNNRFRFCRKCDWKSFPSFLFFFIVKGESFLYCQRKVFPFELFNLIHLVCPSLFFSFWIPYFPVYLYNRTFPIHKLSMSFRLLEIYNGKRFLDYDFSIVRVLDSWLAVKV